MRLASSAVVGKHQYVLCYLRLPGMMILGHFLFKLEVNCYVGVTNYKKLFTNQCDQMME